MEHFRRYGKTSDFFKGKITNPDGNNKLCINCGSYEIEKVSKAKLRYRGI